MVRATRSLPTSISQYLLVVGSMNAFIKNSSLQPTKTPFIMSPPYHVVALPYPGRGHINPMMILCKLLSSKFPETIITFIVTEEWLGLIGSETKPDTISFLTIPNVLPLERERAANMKSFFEAVIYKMEEPFENLLDKLVVRPTILLADVFVSWVVDVGKRRTIPVALLWPMPASVYSIFYHFELDQNRQSLADLSVLMFASFRSGGRTSGLSPITVADLPSLLFYKDQIVQNILTLISNGSKAQYLLFNSFFELEAQVFQALKQKFPCPIYSLGPLIPFTNLQKVSDDCHPEYFRWLDSQPRRSVLYVSSGSFLSVTSTQMDEIVAGLSNSGVRYLLVARDKPMALKKEANGEMGIVVPWCDQLRVLCHSSIGGFWTHCGWSSTMESVFAGVPMIGFPITMDQLTTGKIIAEDWKIGWKVKGAAMGRECLVTRDEICELIKRFMDPENEEKNEMIRRATHLKEICRGAIREGGSSEDNLGCFIRHILK